MPDVVTVFEERAPPLMGINVKANLEAFESVNLVSCQGYRWNAPDVRKSTNPAFQISNGLSGLPN